VLIRKGWIVFGALCLAVIAHAPAATAQRAHPNQTVPGDCESCQDVGNPPDCNDGYCSVTYDCRVSFDGDETTYCGLTSLGCITGGQLCNVGELDADAALALPDGRIWYADIAYGIGPRQLMDCQHRIVAVAVQSRDGQSGAASGSTPQTITL
jgi:hypothetical protein